MSYLVLARKCRPKAFQEVVGQQHITQTLKNSILSGRIAHSFLFTGPRGVGKTTTARILAKSLNCPNASKGEPCNSCAVCQEITQGSFVDVLEIDGASNNSVDDIRDLREKIRYVPTAGRYKIYIVDEVHMLSTAAFNALLKTLEEPPGHAIFIFATTEPHKIPATILSRCQRFDFKRLQPREIAAALQDVVKSQGWEVSASVLALIARSADGSMRDAQSILDQVISCSEGDISYDEVLYLLGMVKKDQIQAIWAAVFNHQPQAILSGIAQVLERGYDLRFFAEQLLHYLRDLLVCKTCHDPAPLLDLSEDEVLPLKKQSDLVCLEDLQQYFQLLVQSLDRMRGASHPQIILEMTLVQMARMELSASFAEILRRMSALEEALRLGGTLMAEGEVEPKDSPASPSPDAPLHEPPLSAGPAGFLKPAAPQGRPLSVGETPCSPLEPEELSSSSPSPLSFTTPAAPASASPPASTEQKWSAMLNGIKKEKQTLAPILQQARLDSITGDTVTLSFPKNPPFYLDTINKEGTRSVLQRWCQTVFGAHYRLECRARESSGQGKCLSSEEKEGCTSTEIDAIISRYPMARIITEIFSAQIVQTDVSFLRKD
ncbi:MAG: DNA polymerase III subunit gamma/tau [bacterium]